MSNQLSPTRHLRSGLVVGLVTATMLSTAGQSSADPAPPEPRPPAPTVADIPCTALHVVGFQGTDQSGDQSDPTFDAGFLGQSVTGPLKSAGGDAVSSQLVPYASDFGRRGESYVKSMTGGINNGLQSIADYSARCPQSSFAVIGYSQGGQVADEIVRLIGAGDPTAPIPATKLAAASIFSSPIRPPDAAIFPGAPGMLSPATPPGVASSALANLTVDATTVPDGGGISTSVSNVADYGPLTGRVASWCRGGDIACATPVDAPLARTIANIGGQVDHLDQQDPLQTAADLTVALGGAALRTAAGVVNDDLNFSGGRFTITPGRETVLGRLAVNSDPRSAGTRADADIVSAVVKLGVMGFNAAVTVAKKVLTPANIAQFATVGLADPVAGLAAFGMKLGGAVLDLFPPATINQGIQYIFHQIQSGIVDNQGLVKMATDLRVWDVQRQHTSYDAATDTSSGQTPATFTVEWFTALAQALATGTAGASTEASDTETTTAPTGPAPMFPADASSTKTRPTGSTPTPLFPTSGTFVVPTPLFPETSDPTAAPTSAAPTSSESR
ncbi:cutinase family protein [Antrihabitans sp. YC3-6]|uniref:Cutinase family protein n=1 Tax=Antrihabitans stalagmiti TaxID=2799499 RepID=A0A934U6X1_9NOCA|nr:cutinase family protein [Antrihabitans stalagmiti]MBJ8342959.1 cutinase family protein [Antrihabitans stalagmiti]